MPHKVFNNADSSNLNSKRINKSSVANVKMFITLRDAITTAKDIPQN